MESVGLWACEATPCSFAAQSCPRYLVPDAQAQHSLLDRPLRAFIRDVGARSAAPGGGSVAAAAAAMVSSGPGGERGLRGPANRDPHSPPDSHRPLSSPPPRPAHPRPPLPGVPTRDLHHPPTPTTAHPDPLVSEAPHRPGDLPLPQPSLGLAQGAALACMVGQMTYGRRQFEHLDAAMRRLIPPFHAAMGQLTALVDADAKAFAACLVGAGRQAGGCGEGGGACLEGIQSIAQSGSTTPVHLFAVRIWETFGGSEV